VLDERINKYAFLHRRLGRIYENWKIFRRDLPCQEYNLSFVYRVLLHKYVFDVMGDFA
jgi:hypothetical protein